MTDIDNITNPNATTTDTTEKKKRVRKVAEPLNLYYDHAQYTYEICIDECARGPFLGDVYIACAIIGRDVDFDYSGIKDSKKFSSKKKMKEVAELIKSKFLFHHITSVSVADIDNTDILQAVFKGMHACVKSAVEKICELEQQNPKFDLFRDVIILVDGDKFRPYMIFDEASGTMRHLIHTTIEQGDAKYVGIAGASIIAKVAHDEYIYKLCETYPQLIQRYAIDSNVGYGTAKHIEGIRRWGITQFHRRTFGICKTQDVTVLVAGERDPDE